MRKIPEFLTFVREVQGLVVSEMRGNGSIGTSKKKATNNFI